MPEVKVELNFFYMHYNDAKTFAKWALDKRDGDVNPSIFVRHAIISVVFASEALINRVLAEFAVDSKASDIIEKINILDKWYLSPFLCNRRGDPTPFNKGEEPFQSFQELIKIRNWLVHPRTDTFLRAEMDIESSIIIGESGEEYPWLEMQRGELWPQTKIPMNPFEMDFTHADAALGIIDSMIDSLREKLAGRIDNDWLYFITVKDAEGRHLYKAPVKTIWPGYGGAKR